MGGSNSIRMVNRRFYKKHLTQWLDVKPAETVQSAPRSPCLTQLWETDTLHLSPALLSSAPVGESGVGGGALLREEPTTLMVIKNIA